MPDRKKHHPLQDAVEPNLVEETFDYDLPPRILFESPIAETIDGEVVEFDAAAMLQRDIHITKYGLISALVLLLAGLAWLWWCG